LDDLECVNQGLGKSLLIIGFQEIATACTSNARRACAS
jgi:hypothetical protein